MVTRSAANTLYASEYQYVDGTETVTVRHPDTGDEDTSVVAKRSPLQALDGSFNPMDIHETDQPWIVYAATLSFSLITGAEIVDSAGIVWKVRAFSLFRWDTQYHCICARVPKGAT